MDVEVIRTEGLTKRFGAVAAVEDLDLSVRQGEVFGFLGPNGAGKTTTIRLLLGLLRPTTGRAWIRGVPAEDVKSGPPARGVRAGGGVAMAAAHRSGDPHRAGETCPAVSTRACERS